MTKTILAILRRAAVSLLAACAVTAIVSPLLLFTVPSLFPILTPWSQWIAEVSLPILVVVFAACYAIAVGITRRSHGPENQPRQ